MSNGLRTLARLKSPMLLAALLGGAMVAALGMHAMNTPPSRVAVVRMNVLMESLAQGTEDLATLKAMQEEAQADLNAKIEDLKKRRVETKDITDLTRREGIVDQIVLDEINLKYAIKLSQNEVMLEQSLRFEQLYKLITTTIAEIARTEAYDLVVIDDSRDELKLDPDSQMPDWMQRQRQLASRRVLYSGTTIDITEALTVKMNNAFKAKGS